MNDLINLFVDNPDLSTIYNYFVSITPVFFIWGMIELAFKIVMNVLTGHNILGNKDFRLRRFSE